MMTQITAEEVAKHDNKDDLWVIIDDRVFDLSEFGQGLHPGGLPPLLDVAGRDGTQLFYELHRASVLEEKRFQRYCIGTLAGAEAPKADERPMPYGDAFGFWRKSTPYYSESHTNFRAAIKEWIREHILPDCVADDEAGTYPSLELNQKMAQFGMIACLVMMEERTGPLTRELGITLPGGLTPEEYDPFHGLIISEEFRAIGCYGYGDGLFGGQSIGFPPVLKFGSEEMVRRICPDIMLGKKRICLAVSEPYAGSDVAQIRTRGILSEDGSHWIVTGVKKWITGGMFADYFTTLVSTDKGMCLMLIERDEEEEQLNTKPIKTSYSMSAGTSYVEMNECRVPRENVIGDEGKGFQYAMANFNTERWGMICSGNRMSRLMVEECFKWAMQRKIFGKRLIDQPVIRYKLAQMAAEVEAVHSMLEDVTYQMKESLRIHGNETEMNKRLAGPIALLKFKQTRVAQLCSDNACQILGGRALTRSGMGVLVEKFQRSQKMQAILGGSEEILADFAIRQAMKQIPETARL